MKKLMMLCGFVAVVALAPVANAQSVKRWGFDKSGDQEGWTVLPRLIGPVFGGAMWLHFSPRTTDIQAMTKWTYQENGDDSLVSQGKLEPEDASMITSPAGLGIVVREPMQLRLRVINLSPITDFLVAWRTSDQVWHKPNTATDASNSKQIRRCSMTPDTKDWQEVICSIDPSWTGTIDQIALLGGAIRGDLWIDFIEIVPGRSAPLADKPDLASDRVMPHVSIPGISQQGFEEAFKVFDRNLTVEAPIQGFNYPSVGWMKNSGWLTLDLSLAVNGTKWVNSRFSENIMRGFAEMQALNPDGRIDMWPGAAINGQVGDVSPMPRIFDVAWDMARRTQDEQLRDQIYQMMCKYVDWWLSGSKRDAQTGLVWAYLVDETWTDTSESPQMAGRNSIWEHFSHTDDPRLLAPIDLNVQVAAGAYYAAQLGKLLGKPDADVYRKKFDDLANAINTHLWDEKSGAYYNYDLPAHRLRLDLIASTFDPLRLGIAPDARKRRLLPKLVDPKLFNWGRWPLTSVARTNPAYDVASAGTKPNYDVESENDSWLAWFGNVWPLTNPTGVKALEEAGRPDLAAELNWKTIQIFHINYREYANPDTGKGGGAQDTTATAAIYIAAIIDHLFGIDYDAIEKRLTISPHIPKELYGKELKIERLILPTAKGDTRLSLSLRQSGPSRGRVEMAVSGPLPEGTLELSLPSGRKKVLVPMQAEWSGELQ